MPLLSSLYAKPTVWNPPSPFNLAVIALFLSLLGLGFAYLLVAAANNPASLSASVWSTPVIEKTLAGTKISVPAAWVRTPSADTGDFNDQLDLRLNLRFAPEARLYALKVRLIPLYEAQPSSYLLDAVYLRLFSSSQLNGVPGLVGKPLKPALGFQNETVWYDPLSARPFVAKCLGAGTDRQPASCLRTQKLTSRLAAVYRFDADVLAYWREFDAAVQPLLAQIGVFSTP